MPTTPLGITYPASTDHNRLWEHFQTLANKVDALMPVAYSADLGATVTGISTGRQDAVTLPTAGKG